MENIGQTLRDLRLKHHYNINDIAYFLKTSQSYVSNVELGKVDPTFSRVLDFLKIYDLEFKITPIFGLHQQFINFKN